LQTRPGLLVEWCTGRPNQVTRVLGTLVVRTAVRGERVAIAAYEIVRVARATKCGFALGTTGSRKRFGTLAFISARAWARRCQLTRIVARASGAVAASAAYGRSTAFGASSVIRLGSTAADKWWVSGK